MAKYLIGNIKGPKGDRGEAGPTYTAGTGIDITNNVISATNSGGITTETDPVFSASPAANITTQNISDWNAKSDFDGDYNDLTNKPDLTVYATTTALGTGLARKQDTLTAGENITIENNVISATGGGGSNESEVFLLTSTSTNNPELLALIAAGNAPKFIQLYSYGPVYSLWTDGSNVTGGTIKWLNYRYQSTPTEQLQINIKVDNPVTQIMQIATPSETLNGNLITVNAGGYGSLIPSISGYGNNLVGYFRSIGTNFAQKTEIPTPDGTTITESNGVWSAVGGGSAEDELPAIAAGDAGKVLTVNSGETGVEWTTPASGGGSISMTDNDNITWNGTAAASVLGASININTGSVVINTPAQNFGNNNKYTITSQDYNIDTHQTDFIEVDIELTDSNSNTQQLRFDISNATFNGANVNDMDSLGAALAISYYSNAYTWIFNLTYPDWGTKTNVSATTSLVYLISRTITGTIPPEVVPIDGTSITVNNGVLSAAGGGSGSYTAGSGIDITNGTISVSPKVIEGSGYDYGAHIGSDNTDTGSYGSLIVGTGNTHSGMRSLIVGLNNNCGDFRNGIVAGEYNDKLWNVSPVEGIILGSHLRANIGGAYGYPLLTGSYNDTYDDTARLVVGIGDAENNRKNGLVLTTDGKLWAPIMAPDALYLKDTNDQVYEITVDTNGTLTATAVSNS